MDHGIELPKASISTTYHPLKTTKVDILQMFHSKPSLYVFANTFFLLFTIHSSVKNFVAISLAFKNWNWTRLYFACFFIKWLGLFIGWIDNLLILLLKMTFYRKNFTPMILFIFISDLRILYIVSTCKWSWMIQDKLGCRKTLECILIRW